MAKALKLDSGYTGEIKLGKPGKIKVDRNGNRIHFVDQETWKSLREQLGVVQERVKDNSMREVLDRAKVPYFNGYKPNFYYKQKGETK